MKKLSKFFLRELRRLSYTFTIFPILACAFIYLFSKGILTMESKVSPFFDILFVDFLLNVNKAYILIIALVVTFIIIWLICYQFKISRKEKASLRVGFEFLTEQFNNLFRVIAGVILALWMLASYGVIPVDEVLPVWLSIAFVFFSFVFTYFSREAYNAVIIKGT